MILRQNLSKICFILYCLFCFEEKYARRSELYLSGF